MGTTAQITFRFRGGCLDGQSVSGDPREPTPALRRYLFLTDAGRVGKRFREINPEVRREIREKLIPENVRRAEEEVGKRFALQFGSGELPADFASVLESILKSTYEEYGLHETDLTSGWGWLQDDVADFARLSAEEFEEYAVVARNVEPHGHVVIDIAAMNENGSHR